MKRKDNKMNDKMKNLILAAAILLTIGSCLLTVSSGKIAQRMRASLERERYNRMVVEEKLEKTASRASSLESELANANNKIKSIQAVMDQGKSSNADLKAQFESVSKLKESLERKLKDLETAGNPAAPAGNAP